MVSVLAADCGGTNLTVARWDDGVVRRATAPTPRRAADIPASIVELALPMAGDAGALGVGVAGLVHHRSGTLVWMPHAAGAEVGVASDVAAGLGMPVVVDNDANMAVRAEGLIGAGAGHRMVLCVTVGTGIGGGIMIDGRIERGRGFAGEIGHIQFEADGRRCRCGRIGCWETVASGSALDVAASRLAKDRPEGTVASLAAGQRASGRHLVAAARSGDGAAAAAVAAVGSALGVGLAGLVGVLDPDVVVLAGSVGVLEPVLGAARDAMMERLEGAEHRSPTPVLAASHGADAGLAGAALAAQEVVR
jgi:glucokinase